MGKKNRSYQISWFKGILRDLGEIDEDFCFYRLRWFSFYAVSNISLLCNKNKTIEAKRGKNKASWASQTICESCCIIDHKAGILQILGLHHCTPPRLSSVLWAPVVLSQVLCSSSDTCHVLVSVLGPRDIAVNKTNENCCPEGVSIQDWKYGQ